MTDGEDQAAKEARQIKLILIWVLSGLGIALGLGIILFTAWQAQNSAEDDVGNYLECLSAGLPNCDRYL